MRLMPAAVAAAAALACAAPSAAAQVNAASLTRAAVERLMANHGSVRDYTVVLEYQDQRIPAYVYRDDDGWDVSLPPETPLGNLLAASLLWVAVTPAGPEERDEVLRAVGEGGIRYAGEAAVDGRRTHVLTGRLAGEDHRMDSLAIYVDDGTRQILRVAGWGRVDGEGNELFPHGGDVRATMDLSEYTEQDGLTIPRSVHLRMALDAELDAAERQAMQMLLPLALVGLRQDPDMDAGELMALELMVQMILEGEVELPVRVVDVRVNSGPPAWPLEDDDSR